MTSSKTICQRIDTAMAVFLEPLGVGDLSLLTEIHPHDLSPTLGRMVEVGLLDVSGGKYARRGGGAR